MSQFDDVVQSMNRACALFGIAAANATPIFEQFNRAAREFAEAAHRLDPLELMGFNLDERQQITDAALGMGCSPVDLGEVIMRCRPLPEFVLPFVFWRDFDWRRAVLLTLVLTVVAVVTG